MPEVEASKDGVHVLELRAVEAYYQGIIRALTSVSLSVPRGQVVCLLGANGAGKTTTLKAASGLLTPERGRVTKGAVLHDGMSVTNSSARELVERGVVQVIEGRRCFPRLNVEENLLSGTLNRSGLVAFTRRRAIAASLERVYAWIPQLSQHRNKLAGLLSGGRQQLLAIGRALMAEPSLLLLDEPSMGLAPLLVDEIFALISNLNKENGLSVLVAEQNARVALRYADYGYVLETGRVATSGTARELLQRDDVQEFYLGLRTTTQDTVAAAQPGV